MTIFQIAAFIFGVNLPPYDAAMGNLYQICVDPVASELVSCDAQGLRRGSQLMWAIIKVR